MQVRFWKKLLKLVSKTNKYHRQFNYLQVTVLNGVLSAVSPHWLYRTAVPQSIVNGCWYPDDEVTGKPSDEVNLYDPPHELGEWPHIESLIPDLKDETIKLTINPQYLKDLLDLAIASKPKNGAVTIRLNPEKVNAVTDSVNGMISIAWEDHDDRVHQAQLMPIECRKTSNRMYVAPRMAPDPVELEPKKPEKPLSLPSDWHKSITADKVMAFAEESLMDINDVGICVDCGHEQTIEPDAMNVRCDNCGHYTVMGAQNLALHIAA